MGTPVTSGEGQALAGRVLGGLSALVPIGIVVVHPDGRIWYQNQRWEDVTGIPNARQIGRHWFEVVHAHDVEEVAAQWRSQLERRGRFGPFRTVSAAGVVRECQGESTPVLDPDGTLVGFVIVVADAEHDDRYPTLTGPHVLDRLLDQSEDVITILNPDGSWRWSSAGALRLVGNQLEYDPSEGIFPFLHPDEVADARETLARVAAGTGRPGERFEYRVRAADGSWRHMEVLIDNLIDDPDVGGVVVHCRDMSERRAMMDELAKSHQRLAEIDVNKTETMAMVSHELRTPLTAITGFAELLREMLDPSAGAEQIEYVDTILRNARQLLRLSNDLVALDHLEAGTVALSIAPVDLPATLRQVVYAIEPTATEKGITLSVDVADGPDLSGDEVRLAQLFDNLLSNAIKFTPADGRVMVRGAPVDDGWEVEVSDTGVGVPPDEQALLFSRFFRASNARSGGLDGRGLGLSIAKAIVDLHRGQITLNTALGSGTTIRVVLRAVAGPVVE